MRCKSRLGGYQCQSLLKQTSQGTTDHSLSKRLLGKAEETWLTKFTDEKPGCHSCPSPLALWRRPQQARLLPDWQVCSCLSCPIVNHPRSATWLPNCRSYMLLSAECRRVTVTTHSTLPFLDTVLQRHARLTLQSVWRSSPHLCCRCSQPGPQLECEQEPQASG